MHRVSGIDAAFLYGETADWHMHVSAVVVMDPTKASTPFTFERLKQRLGYVVPEGRTVVDPDEETEDAPADGG